MFDQAEDVYKKQLAIAKDLADNTLMASNYASLGNVMKAQRNLAKPYIYTNMPIKFTIKLMISKDKQLVTQIWA